MHSVHLNTFSQLCIRLPIISHALYLLHLSSKYWEKWCKSKIFRRIDTKIIAGPREAPFFTMNWKVSVNIVWSSFNQILSI